MGGVRRLRELRVKWKGVNQLSGSETMCQRVLRGSEDSRTHIVTETQSNGNGKEKILTMFHFQIERF